MKKFFIVNLLIFFLFFNVNVIAQSKTFSQGIYHLSDLNLLTDKEYKIKNISITNRSLLLVFDSTMKLQEFMRFDTRSPEYLIRPLKSDYMIVILGKGELIFS